MKHESTTSASTDIALLLLLLPVFSPAQGCAPTHNNSTGKREVDEVHVTVVTNQKYNPSLNDEHLKTMRAMVGALMLDLVNEAVTKVNDRFAVVYTVLGADCDQMNNFAHGVKSQAGFITQMEVKCGGKPEFVIN
ncbi:hypothetical protein Y032_0374g206 [Ancylostoma ceylanicum]|uniref:Uncharacterized protein n=1 Tax=Ancylostoma ceylanicum TaxID=53326 RepID=A0A016RTX8_9BILA|nr:hypothetical protein Y032_0374g206 [Ancylostoma ceylanicum]